MKKWTKKENVYYDLGRAEGSKYYFFIGLGLGIVLTMILLILANNI